MDIIVCLFFILFLFFIPTFLGGAFSLLCHCCFVSSESMEDDVDRLSMPRFGITRWSIFFLFLYPALFSGLLFLFFFHRVVFLLFGFIYLFISLGRNAVSRVVCCFSFIFYHENWSPTIFRRCVFYYFSLLFFFYKTMIFVRFLRHFRRKRERRTSGPCRTKKVIIDTSLHSWRIRHYGDAQTFSRSSTSFYCSSSFFVVIISSHLSLTLYLIDISISIYLLFIRPSCLSSFVSTCATPCVCVFVIVIDGVHYELEWLERRRFSSHSTLSILFLTWLSRMLLVWTSWFNFLLPVANRRICRIKKKKLRKEDDETQQTDRHTHINQQRIRKKNPFSTRCRCCARPC